MVGGMALGHADASRRDAAEADILGVLNHLVEKVVGVEQAVTVLQRMVEQQVPVAVRDWYTTGELAEALGLSQYTIQARWCAEGRIECEKDQDTQRWRIPAREYDRLARGGSPKKSGPGDESSSAPQPRAGGNCQGRRQPEVSRTRE